MRRSRLSCRVSWCKRVVNPCAGVCFLSGDTLVARDRGVNFEQHFGSVAFDQMNGNAIATGELRGQKLTQHAAFAARASRRVRSAFDVLRTHARDFREELGIWILPRILIVEALDVGEDDESLSAQRSGNQCGEAIVVAKLNFSCRDSVVFVENWNGSPIDQTAKCIGQVLPPRSMRQIFGRK